MHQMLVRHTQQSGVLPGRGQGFPAGQSRLPPAPLAPDREGFHAVADLRDIAGLDRTRAAGTGTGDPFMLERPDELFVRGDLLGKHQAVLF